MSRKRSSRNGAARNASRPEQALASRSNPGRLWPFQREVTVTGWQQDAAAILDVLPSRIHQVMDPFVAATPDRTALIDDSGILTYGELDHAVGETADALRALGIRTGDRMMIVSENSIPLACMLLAASRL